MRIQNLLALIVVAILLTACGGGGGGSDSGSSGSYTGLTTEAALTEENAQEMGLDAFFSTGASRSFGGASLTATEQALVAEATIANLPQTIFEAISANVPSGTARALINETVDGIQVSGELNESTGTFSGVFTYTDWQSDGVSINGSMTVYAENLFSDNDAYMEVSFSNLSIDTNGISTGTMNGTMTVQQSGVDLTFSMDLVTTEDNGDQCMIDDYQVTVSGTDQVSISGVFYHSEYGYVTVATTTPITTDSNDYPNSGVIEIIGADNTRAVVTFSPGYANIVADCDGDGALDDLSVTEAFYGGL